MKYLHPETNTTVTDTGITYQEYVYVYPRLRVVPDLSALLWARELKLYLDWYRPKKEENPCWCKRCTRDRENNEGEYWNVLICDGCDGMREVATPCPRCDSATYRPTYRGAAPKGPPTGFGPYRERSRG